MNASYMQSAPNLDQVRYSLACVVSVPVSVLWALALSVGPACPPALAMSASNQAPNGSRICRCLVVKQGVGRASSGAW